LAVVCNSKFDRAEEGSLEGDEMYNIILVPVDGSKRAERILPYVEELACARESIVIFMQVVEPELAVTNSNEIPPYLDMEKSDRIVAEAKDYLTSLVGEMRDKGLAAKYVIEYGPIVRAILDVAEREKASLIAMASHGRTGLARAFYGSVTAGVLQQTDRPLLLIRSANAP
jgi:nucleotide-binding universal stress UspA family protein